MKGDSNRYCLVRDDDAHWYLITISEKNLFKKLCEEAYQHDKYDKFNFLFEDKMISGPQMLSFADPLEET